MDKVKITTEIIELGQSNEGDWNQAQLQVVGVDWSPIKGWKSRPCGEEFTQEQLNYAFAASCAQHRRSKGKQPGLYPIELP